LCAYELAAKASRPTCNIYRTEKCPQEWKEKAKRKENGSATKFSPFRFFFLHQQKQQQRQKQRSREQ